MARIAFCMPALPSHAAVHAALARALARAGHDCWFVGTDRLGPLAAHEGVGFDSLGPGGGGDLRGAGLVRTLLATAAATRAFVRAGPPLLDRLRPDLVIADQAEPGASLAAEACGIPRVTLAAALPLDRDEAVPPPFVGWDWAGGEAGRKRNRGGWRVADALMVLQARALTLGCEDHRLPVRTRFDEWISDALDLRQMVPALDFPHQAGPGAIAVGPLRDADAGRFDEGDDDRRPLIFASLGTLAGRRRALLTAIAGAAADLDLRLALAHAGTLSETECAALSGRPIARARFDQRAVLARAAACITHAGLNTVLDCAAAGVPMVAIPLAFEQPATAARLRYHGAARVMDRRRADRAAIREALRDVLDNPGWRNALMPAQAEIAAARGAPRAAGLVQAMLAGKMAA